MKDNSRNSYQARLPFGLKQKPIPHYIDHGIIRFNMDEGVMHYTVKLITKSVNAPIIKGIVKTKEQLDKLLATKTLSDVQALELVIQ